jgi:DNA-binding NarL/FixJ family response regulator
VPIKVVITDDHTLVRQGLRRYLEDEDGIEVLGEASTGGEAVSLVARARPDVAILDIRMPEMDGIQAAREIAAAPGDTRVIMLTAHDDRRLMVEAVQAGARGYVLKVRDAEYLVRSVRLVAEGNLVIDPDLVSVLAEELSEARTGRPGGETLTERELEILQLLAFGYTNRDIGRRLYISPDTVKTHLEHVYQKLGASDRTAAVAEAFRRRLIE